MGLYRRMSCANVLEWLVWARTAVSCCCCGAARREIVKNADQEGSVHILNIMARSLNCCHGNATTRSLCILTYHHVAINNIKLFSTAIVQQWVSSPLHCCRATKCFVLLSTLQT
jgi:hypothetical protein